MVASSNGHTQVVDLLLQKNADVNIQAKNGITALLIAVICKNFKVAEYLLHTNADTHIIVYSDEFEVTVLLMAALTGNRDFVNLLLDKAEPRIDEIEKALISLFYFGCPSLIALLSNKLPYLTNDQRELLDSCVKGDLGAVIMKTLDSPDTPLVLGLTPLMVASSCGHVDIVDALIQAGADVNKQESYWGLTPLFFAVREGKSALTVETLLENDANPNIIVSNETPLDVANDTELKTIIRLLTKYGGQTASQVQEKKEYSDLSVKPLLPASSDTMTMVKSTTVISSPISNELTSINEANKKQRENDYQISDQYLN